MPMCVHDALDVATPDQARQRLAIKGGHPVNF
jgi:hypothetical protein